MKLKLPKQEMMFLEDVLLSVYYDMDFGTLEASPKVREILDAVQEKLYGNDV